MRRAALVERVAHLLRLASAAPQMGQQPCVPQGPGRAPRSLGGRSDVGVGSRMPPQVQDEDAPTLQASTVRKGSDAPCTCHLLNYSLDRYRKRNNATVVAASPRPLWRWAEAHLKLPQGALRSLPVCTSGVASTSRAWLRSRPLGWFKRAHVDVGGSVPVAHLASLKAQGVPTHPNSPPPSPAYNSLRPSGRGPCSRRSSVRQRLPTTARRSITWSG